MFYINIFNQNYLQLFISHLQLAQAWSQNSVTGRGQKNYLRGHKLILPSFSGGRPKKSSSRPYTFLRRKSRSGRGGARLLPGGARRNPMERISLLDDKFRGEDQEKVVGAKSWAQSWRSFVLFVLERNFTHTWENTSSILGGTGPEMHSSSIGPATSFQNTILAWGGTSSDLGGHDPKMPLVAPA